MNEEESVVLVDEKGQDRVGRDGTVETVSKTDAHLRGLRHRAISVFIFNSRKEMLLQKRTLDKYHSGGLWTNACCTHPGPGELPSDAARRRLKEEMGLVCDLAEILQFHYFAEVGRGVYENEYDHVFVGWKDGIPTPDGREVGDWKWMEVDELKEDLVLYADKYSFWLRYCFNEVMESVVLSGIRQSEKGNNEHDEITETLP